MQNLKQIRPILKQNHIQLSNIHQFSSFEPVRLAYASYESTKTPTSVEPSPLIVKHGLFGSKSNWNSLCKVYHNKTGRKIIAVDARNHGDSPHTEEHSYTHLALDLKALVEQLQFKKTAFLGHSMGGRAVMYFALKYPELVEKLIVADVSPVRISPDVKTLPTLLDIMQKMEMPKNVPMSKARLATDKQLARHISDKGLRNFLLTNLVQKLDGSYMWRINIASLIANFDEIAKFPNVKEMVFKGPTLFVGGGASDFLQKSDHDDIRKLFPNAEFKYIEGAGHWLHSEKPNEFLQCTVDFLNK